MDLTLGDLLDHKDLGLRLVTGADDVRGRTVRGAHPVEITAPTRWVPEDWVMLTNGLRLRGRPEEQRRLVAELDAGGQAALGWAVGTVMQRVPRALADEARRRSFPVFLVPLETAFHQIVSFLGEARAHDDVYVMHRVAAMEDYLMDALAAARPEQAAVRRLASLLSADVLLATEDGDPVEASGALPGNDLRAAVRTRDPDAVAAVTGRAGSLSTVRPDGVAERVLVVTPNGEWDARLARPLVHRAVQLLELLGRRQARSAEATRRQGADLLDRCLAGIDELQLAALDARSAALGVHVEHGAHAVTWEPGEASGYDHARALLDASGLPHLLTTHAGHPVALVRASRDDMSRALDDHSTAAEPAVGVGTEIRSLRGFPASLAGGHVALLTRRADASDLDPLGRLLVTATTTGGLDALRAYLDPLRDKPHLLDSVSCWLAVDCDVTRAAERLHVHRNSLRYRLAQVERLVGLATTAPDAKANLRLALLADRLHARLGG